MIEIFVAQIQANFFERKKAALSLSNLYLTSTYKMAELSFQKWRKEKESFMLQSLCVLVLSK